MISKRDQHFHSLFVCQCIMTVPSFQGMFCIVDLIQMSWIDHKCLLHKNVHTPCLQIYTLFLKPD